MVAGKGSVTGWSEGLHRVVMTCLQTAARFALAKIFNDISSKGTRSSQRVCLKVIELLYLLTEVSVTLKVPLRACSLKIETCKKFSFFCEENELRRFHLLDGSCV